MHFLASDCPRHQFTQRFHNQLVHCFGVASCYDRRSFWTEHFKTTQGKAAFVEQVARHPASGTPNPVWQDVEREVSRRVRQSGLLDLYRRHVADNAGPGIPRAVLAPVILALPARAPRRRGEGGRPALGR